MENEKPLYKAEEMEEFLDLKFYHPLGYKLAKKARDLNLTPNQVTYISMAFGILGGALLAFKCTLYPAFILLVFSSVLDSADGQLARMTGKGTLKGRILDGLIGYFSYAAAYIGLAVLYMRIARSYGSWYILVLVVLGTITAGLHSSMYDFYRTTYASVAGKDRLPDEHEEHLTPFFARIYAMYHVYQNLLASSHLRILSLLKKRNPSGELSAADQNMYRMYNRRTVHMWNMFGDNTRFIAIFIAIVMLRPDMYFILIIGPLTAIFCAAIFVQRCVDGEFYAKLSR